MGGQVADRVGGGGVTRQQRGLAPATAEIDCALGAVAAGQGHPCFTSEAVKARRFVPNVGQRMFPDILEL